MHSLQNSGGNEADVGGGGGDDGVSSPRDAG